MNNLLQSLSSQRLKLRVGDSDLKRLLSSVKEGRGHDVKLSDAFYDSLEGVLLDLRAVTLDNRDAEAFLKPVSKIDYPDYYEIIKEPMDLQTMLKKVKQKQYKSKAEFSDDLELIWSNCFIYNTGDNHPLRMCAKRLQEKAHRLLKNITDRRDRLDPPVPVELRTNGVIVNGHSRKHSMTPIPKARANSISTSALKKSAASTPTPPPPRRELFEDSPAFVRSAAGMSSFLELDCDLDNIDTSGAGPSRLPVIEKLRRIVEGSEEEEDVYGMETMNGDVGDKRKLAVNGDGRPRKRARTRLRAAEADPVDFWWEASTSSSLMANGLPTLTYTSSTACEQAHLPNLPSPPQPAPAPARIRRRKKKRPPAKQQQQQGKSLLDLISNNIRTLKRVRGVNDKFLALNLNSEDGPGPGAIEPLEPEAPEVLTEVDALVDDRPWRSRGTDLEIGVEDANDCLSWMGTKILEHSGFQSTSRAALDVFTGVAAEYLFNVGRTLRYLCDKYSQQMTAEEIILHTLFEHGITHVRDLESYITDDVMRYGTRLTDMEKKLVNAYNEATSELVLDDDAFFGNDEEEEDGELVMGNFADAFGDDFLGLRELGIASELGLQSLTIPKKLLKGKNKQRNAEDSTKPKEPPLPYPPPPPFIPLESSNVDNQIGLLKNFYVQRFNEHAARTSSSLPPPFIKPPPRPLSPTTTLDLELNGQDVAAYQQEQAQNAVPVPNPAAPTFTLPDDPPPPARTKSGPLGQILHPSTSSSAKKKKKPKDGVHGPAGPGAGRPPGDDAYGGLLGPSGASVVQMDDAQQADRKASPQKADALMPPVVVASA